MLGAFGYNIKGAAVPAHILSQMFRGKLFQVFVNVNYKCRLQRLRMWRCVCVRLIPVLVLIIINITLHY